MCDTLFNSVMSQAFEPSPSDIGDIDSPSAANVGGRPTRVDPKLFGKPSDLETDVDGDTSSGCFVAGLVSSTTQTEEWLDEASSAGGELRVAVPARRETDKTLYMSLAMVCKYDALDVVKTVTRKRGFESWRKLCKEYGSTTGTSLHEYSNLLEYDFGTTDGFKKKLLKWESQIADVQKATGEVFSDRLKCAIVLTRSPGPIRTYLRVQNRGDYGALRMALMSYLEADDDSNGPVPMEVGAMKGSCKKGDKGKKGYAKGNYGKSFGKYDKSNEYRKNNECAKVMRKARTRERKANAKDKERTRDQHPTRASKATAGHVASGCTRRANVGKVTFKEWRKFRVLPRVQWRRVQRPHTCSCEDGSGNSRDQ